MHGSVAAYDEAQGLGTIRSDDGVDHPFHCTQITDGTRTITVGISVTFDVMPKLGRWEATAITPR